MKPPPGRMAPEAWQPQKRVSCGWRRRWLRRWAISMKSSSSIPGAQPGDNRGGTRQDSSPYKGSWHDGAPDRICAIRHAGQRCLDGRPRTFIQIGVEAKFIMNHLLWNSDFLPMQRYIAPLQAL